jgi:hypothetical protein
MFLFALARVFLIMAYSPLLNFIMCEIETFKYNYKYTSIVNRILIAIIGDYVNTEVQQLAKTLLASKLAASASEAQRMAQDMLGVAEKVHADSKKDHIYAVDGYKPEASAPKPPSTRLTLSNPTFNSSQQSAAAPSSPSPSAAAFSSSSNQGNPSQGNQVLTAQPHPNMPQQQQAVQQATTSPSPDSASVDQGEVVSSQSADQADVSPSLPPAQENSPTPSPSSWADDSHSPSASSEPQAVGISVDSAVAEQQQKQQQQQQQQQQSPVTSQQASQQAQMLASESLSSPSVSRPEDAFASQYAGKTLSELSAESEGSHTNQAPEPAQAQPQQKEQQQQSQESQQQGNFSSPSFGFEPSQQSSPSVQEHAQTSSESQKSDFLNLRSEPQEQQMSSTEAPSTSSSLDTGWPASGESEPQPVSPEAAEQPQQPEEPQSKERFTPEEKKLQEDVDLAKVFNFGNR